MNEYKGWRYSARIKRQEDTTECYLSFYKQMEDRDWYDEVRFDSHERKRGKRTELPHFHVKLQLELQRKLLKLRYFQQN